MFTNSNLFSFEEGKALNQDIEIYYRDYGPIDAEPILLVQGLGGQLINWPRHLIEFLIDNNFRPIVFDNRDSGLSTRVESDLFSDEKRTNTILQSYIRYYLRLPIKSEYTIDDMASDAIAVLDELNINQAHVLGISMGGMIAQIIASNFFCSSFFILVSMFPLISSTLIFLLIFFN